MFQLGAYTDPILLAHHLGWSILLNDTSINLREFDQIVTANDCVALAKGDTFIQIGLWYNNTIHGISFYELDRLVRKDIE